jgi:hypothetical protein
MSTSTSTQITITIIYNHTLWTNPKNKTIKKGKFDVAYEEDKNWKNDVNKNTQSNMYEV